MELRILTSKSLAAFATFAAFAAPLTAGDFNGDGRDDLVINARLENQQHQVFSAVEIMYANAGGLTSTGSVILTEHADQGVGDALGVDFGSATAVGDFDGDGFDDLAIAADQATVGGVLGAGAVDIYLGSAQGLVYKRTLHQNVSGMKDKCETSDHFGSALAAGDFDGDGRADLAIGVDEKVSGKIAAGAVHVVYGGKNGPSPSHDEIWNQNTSGINDSAEEFDFFGAELTTGRVDGDAFDDLVIGVPGEQRTHETFTTNGAVAIIYGSDDGLTKSKDVLFDYFQAYGVDGPAGFGQVLEVADFDKNGVAEIVVGVPNQFVVTANAGAVIFLPIENKKPNFAAVHSLALGPSNLPGDQPRMGASLAVADFNGDNYPDLAVGLPDSGYSGVAAAGLVWVVRGGLAGLDSNNGQYLDRNVGQIFGACQESARFGAALAAGDYNGDGKSELAIGVPQDDYNEGDAGSVTVLIGTATTLDTTTNSQFWTQLALNAANYFHGEFGRVLD